MNIKSVNLVYFSPTQSTKKIVHAFAISLAIKAPTRHFALTTVKEREKEHIFNSEDLVIISTPSYYGRVPVVSPSLFSNITGNNTPVIITCCYGNRSYDDTLLELKELLESKGFYCIAAAAFVAEHALASKLGTDRPNAADILKISKFGALVKEKIYATEIVPVVSAIPGKSPYTALPPSSPIAPVTNSKCIYCMLCFRWCPTDAIADYSPNDTDVSKCIKCQGCVKRCPISAREIVSEPFKERIANLEATFANVVCEPELFL